MKLPGFTADASVYTSRSDYSGIQSANALDQYGMQKAGGVQPAASCQELKQCCAQCPPGMRALCTCCVQYLLQNC